MTRPFYTSKEMCAILGVGPDTFHCRVTRERWYTRVGLPRPYVDRPLRFDRASIDAWRARHHPAMPQQPPANDMAPAAMDKQAWQARLAEVYGRRRS